MMLNYDFKVELTNTLTLLSQEIMIGPEYQAEIPTLSCNYDDEQGKLQFLPTDID